MKTTTAVALRKTVRKVECTDTRFEIRPKIAEGKASEAPAKCIQR